MSNNGDFMIGNPDIEYIARTTRDSETEVRQLKESYEALKRSFDDEKMRTALERSEFEKKIERLMDIKLDNLSFQFQSIENNLKSTIAELKQEVNNLQLLNAEKDDMIAKQSHESAQLLEDLTNLRRAVSNMDTNTKTLKFELSQSKETLDMITAQNISFNDRMDALANSNVANRNSPPVPIISPDIILNRNITHDDVPTLLNALRNGSRRLEFSVHYVDLEKMNNFIFSNTKRHDYHPKSIYRDNGHRINACGYFFSTFIRIQKNPPNKSFKKIKLGLDIPTNTLKLKIDCDFGNYETEQINETKDYKGQMMDQFMKNIIVPSHVHIKNINVRWTVSVES